MCIGGVYLRARLFKGSHGRRKICTSLGKTNKQYLTAYTGFVYNAFVVIDIPLMEQTMYKYKVDNKRFRALWEAENYANKYFRDYGIVLCIEQIKN